MGMPFCELMACTIASARLSTTTARRSIHLSSPAGLPGGPTRLVSNARRAAATARSTSASEASGTVPKVSSVLADVMVAVPAGPIHSSTAPIISFMVR
jgi:hypothetical protein